jgi:hypothetical protein
MLTFQVLTSRAPVAGGTVGTALGVGSVDDVTEEPGLGESHAAGLVARLVGDGVGGAAAQPPVTRTTAATNAARIGLIGPPHRATDEIASLR